MNVILEIGISLVNLFLTIEINYSKGYKVVVTWGHRWKRWGVAFHIIPPSSVNVPIFCYFVECLVLHNYSVIVIADIVVTVLFRIRMALYQRRTFCHTPTSDPEILFL